MIEIGTIIICKQCLLIYFSHPRVNILPEVLCIVCLAEVFLVHHKLSCHAALSVLFHRPTKVCKNSRRLKISIGILSDVPYDKDYFNFVLQKVGSSLTHLPDIMNWLFTAVFHKASQFYWPFISLPFQSNLINKTVSTPVTRHSLTLPLLLSDFYGLKWAPGELQFIVVFISVCLMLY